MGSEATCSPGARLSKVEARHLAERLTKLYERIHKESKCVSESGSLSRTGTRQGQGDTHEASGDPRSADSPEALNRFIQLVGVAEFIGRDLRTGGEA